MPTAGSRGSRAQRRTKKGRPKRDAVSSTQSASDHESAVEEERTSAAVKQINQLFGNNGIPLRIHNFQELQGLEFIGKLPEIYEHIFKREIEGLEREPREPSQMKMRQHSKNTQLVIDCFQQMLGVDMNNISGEQICLANTEMICDLIQTFAKADPLAVVSPPNIGIAPSPDAEIDPELRRLCRPEPNDDMIHSPVPAKLFKSVLSRYLASQATRLRPYVDDAGPQQNRAIEEDKIRRQQHFYEVEARKKKSRKPAQPTTGEKVKKDVAQRRNLSHKQRVAELRRQKFTDELEREAHSRMLRKASRDEQAFKQLFVSAVKVEKEVLREEQRQRNGQMKRQQLEKRQRRQAIQRFYQDQAELLNEKIDTERKMRAVQEKEHIREMELMEKEMEVKLMDKLRHRHANSWVDEEIDQIRRFDAEAISSKLLQTLAKSPECSLCDQAWTPREPARAWELDIVDED